MTKKSFENLKENTIYCECCKRYLPKACYSYSHIRKDCTASSCKYCDWLKRQNIMINDIDKTAYNVLEDIIFGNEKNLNDLAVKHGLKLEEIISIVKKYRPGNKRLTINTKCENCGKDMNIVLSVYEARKNTFCSTDCYYEHKRKNAKRGKDNSQYKRIKTKCTNCEKEIEIIPYDYNTKNSFGDRHNFCSQECYWAFRGKYYIKEKNGNYKRQLSENEKERLRNNLIKGLNRSNRLDTKIQLKINDILNKNHISYEREHIVGYYSVDNYLINFNLFIEVMGDYWHASPLKYGDQKYPLNGIQYRTIRHDKQKHTYVLNHLNTEILYIWERDIEKEPEKCEALILEYIENDGILGDYNSFNYSYNNNILTLNSQILNPYIYQSAESIKKYLKRSA